jgi:8-oxo-dGTP diphosphatase
MVKNADNKILLVEGYTRGWEFPGGYVNSGESIKDAAKREVKEESGIEIEKVTIIGYEHDIKRAKIVVVLSGRVKSGEPKVSIETKDLGFFSYDEAMLKIKLNDFRKRLERCLNGKGTPFFVEMY